MILKNSEEGRFVANVGDVLIVEVIKALDKVGRAAEQGNQSCHIMRNKAIIY
jgi:hypothetical protein